MSRTNAEHARRLVSDVLKRTGLGDMSRDQLEYVWELLAKPADVWVRPSVTRDDDGLTMDAPEE